jgi:hypothetical protein
MVGDAVGEEDVALEPRQFGQAWARFWMRTTAWFQTANGKRHIVVVSGPIALVNKPAK